jgi:hypothetical protein
MITYFAIHLIVISIDNEKKDEFIEKNCHLKTKNNIESLLYNKMYSCVAQKSNRYVVKSSFFF